MPHSIVLIHGTNTKSFLEKLSNHCNIKWPKDYILIIDGVVSHYDSLNEVTSKVGVNPIVLRTKKDW